MQARCAIKFKTAALLRRAATGQFVNSDPTITPAIVDLDTEAAIAPLILVFNQFVHSLVSLSLSISHRLKQFSSLSMFTTFHFQFVVIYLFIFRTRKVGSGLVLVS